jgi:predicted transposase YbfD/YdcC
MTVKGNQERLRFAIADRMRHLASTEVTTIQTQDKGHGRIERRTLTVVSLAVGKDLGWSGACQIGSIQRLRIKRSTGEVLSRQTTYFITSLTPAQATPAALMQIARGHWTIENKVHYVRDVTFHEDASQLRKGAAPRVMAAFRNLVLTVLRRVHATNIALELIRNAAKPERPLLYLLL